MMHLPITSREAVYIVHATHLHQSLGFDPGDWRRWYNRTILYNDYALQNADYWPLYKEGSTNLRDFQLTLPFALRLASAAKTPQSIEVVLHLGKIVEGLRKQGRGDSVPAPQIHEERNDFDFDEEEEEVTVPKLEYVTMVEFIKRHRLDLTQKMINGAKYVAQDVCRKRKLSPKSVPISYGKTVKQYPVSLMLEILMLGILHATGSPETAIERLRHTV